MLNSIGTHGCTTSHGGAVQASQTTATHHGIPMLQAGDGFQCPKCKSWSTLISGSSILSFNGVKAALEGDKFTCGATLIASQSSARVGAGSSSNTSSYSSSNVPYSSLVSKLAQSNLSDEDYGIQYQLLSEQDGKPLTDYYYKIQQPDGEMLEGYTDENGYTTLVQTALEQKEVEITTYDFSQPMPEWE